MSEIQPLESREESKELSEQEDMTMEEVEVLPPIESSNERIESPLQQAIIPREEPSAEPIVEPPTED